MMIIRLCKISLVGAIASFFSLVAFGNLSDYGANEQFVQHVLAMDTIFPNSGLQWRAITNPTLQTGCYWLIIATEIAAAAVLWVGGIRLLAALNDVGFNRAKNVAAAGLTVGLLLYAVGFIVIGGEWFAMWQSTTWNGQQKAFDFVSMIGIVLIIVLLPEHDAPA
jgi:predicted small integral membrane protein